MIPISDDNPTRRRAFMTFFLGLACVVMFLYVQPSGTRSLDMPTDGETLEEIGIRAGEQWQELGGEALQLVPCPNAGPGMSAVIARLARAASP